MCLWKANILCLSENCISVQGNLSIFLPGTNFNFKVIEHLLGHSKQTSMWSYSLVFPVFAAINMLRDTKNKRLESIFYSCFVPVLYKQGTLCGRQQNKIVFLTVSWLTIQLQEERLCIPAFLLLQHGSDRSLLLAVCLGYYRILCGFWAFASPPHMWLLVCSILQNSSSHIKLIYLYVFHRIFHDNVMVLCLSYAENNYRNTYCMIRWAIWGKDAIFRYY